MSRPPARTLKWTPQCDGLWGGMGTESGHVGGGFVGGSAPPGKRLGGKLAPGSAARLVGTQLAQTSAIGRGPHPTPTGQRPARGPPASRLRDSMCVAEAQVCGLGYGSPRGPRRWPRSCREEHAGFRIGRIPEAEMRRAAERTRGSPSLLGAQDNSLHAAEPQGPLPDTSHSHRLQPQSRQRRLTLWQQKSAPEMSPCPWGRTSSRGPEPPVSGLPGCGPNRPGLCHTPGPLRSSPGHRSRPPGAPPLPFFPDVDTTSASTRV